MKSIRDLSKNDFIVVVLAVFISWPCCNGFRIELEKKSSAVIGIAITAASHVMGTARGQDVQTSSFRVCKQCHIFFGFFLLFKILPAQKYFHLSAIYPAVGWITRPKELIFSKLLI